VFQKKVQVKPTVGKTKTHFHIPFDCVFSNFRQARSPGQQELEMTSNQHPTRHVPRFLKSNRMNFLYGILSAEKVLEKKDNIHQVL